MFHKDFLSEMVETLGINKGSLYYAGIIFGIIGTENIPE